MDSNENKVELSAKSGGMRRNGFSFDSLTSVLGTGNQAAAILDFAEQSDQDWCNTENAGGPSLSSQIKALQGADASNESVASCTSIASLSSKSDVGPSTSARQRRLSGPTKVKRNNDAISSPQNSQHLNDCRQMLSGTDNFNKKYMLNWLYRPIHTFSGGISEELSDEGTISAPQSNVDSSLNLVGCPSLDEEVKSFDTTPDQSSRRQRAGSDRGARENNLYAPSNW